MQSSSWLPTKVLRWSVIFSVGAMLLVWPTKALADSPSRQETARKVLTGGTSKRWTYEKIETFMGAENDCTGNGAYWTFKANGTLETLECVGGKLKRGSHHWQLADQDLDLQLVLDDERAFALLIPPARHGREEIELRKYASVKTAATKTLVFVHKSE